MPEEMYDHLIRQYGMGYISEYIRSLIRRDRERRADYAARPKPSVLTANDSADLGAALIELDKLRSILERKDTYND